MRHCILHIGIPKNGSKSIQHTLYMNRDRLAEAKLADRRLGVGHAEEPIDVIGPPHAAHGAEPGDDLRVVAARAVAVVSIVAIVAVVGDVVAADLRGRCGGIISSGRARY